MRNFWNADKEDKIIWETKKGKHSLYTGRIDEGRRRDAGVGNNKGGTLDRKTRQYRQYYNKTGNTKTSKLTRQRYHRDTRILRATPL